MVRVPLGRRAAALNGLQAAGYPADRYYREHRGAPSRANGRRRVPVLWANGPEPYAGALVFRAGQADETLATSGLSHFVEHLALFTAGRRKFDVNGLVDESATVFWASGTREEVCGFLSDVAQALGSISLDRLETERRVLLTEAQARGPHPLGILFGCRFGHAGFGLVNSSELGLYKFVDVTPRELAFELADVIRARAG